MDIIEWSVKTNGGGGGLAPGPRGCRDLWVRSLSLFPLFRWRVVKKKKKEKGKGEKKITKQRVARTSSPSSSLIIYSDGEPSPAGDVIRLRRQSEREKEREKEKKKKKKKEKMKTRVPRVAGEHVNNVLLSPRFGWSESENEREGKTPLGILLELEAYRENGWR